MDMRRGGFAVCDGYRAYADFIGKNDQNTQRECSRFFMFLHCEESGRGVRWILLNGQT